MMGSESGEFLLGFTRKGSELGSERMTFDGFFADTCQEWGPNTDVGMFPFHQKQTVANRKNC
jgi:hypothetical protein